MDKNAPKSEPEPDRRRKFDQPLQLFRRRGWDVAGFVLALLALPGGIYGVFVIHLLLNRDGSWVPFVVAAVVVAALCLKFIVGGFRAATWNGPVLVLDAQGVTDAWSNKTPVPWTNIKRFSLDRGDGDRLTLWLRDVALPDARRSTMRRIGNTLRRTFAGGDVVIDLNPIRYDRTVLKGTLERYLARRES